MSTSRSANDRVRGDSSQSANQEVTGSNPRQGEWFYAVSTLFTIEEVTEQVNKMGSKWIVIGQQGQEVFIGRPLPAGALEIAQEMHLLPEGWFACAEPIL